MKTIYSDSTTPEKIAKARFHIPEHLMMENAAVALEEAVLSVTKEQESPFVLILCGKGNNGGDGIALARRLYGNINCLIVLTDEPGTKESKVQFKMAQAVGVNFLYLKENGSLMLKSLIKAATVVVDCIYGTGFHGEFTPKIQKLLSDISASNAYKIACDVPSGLSKSGKICNGTFRADLTVTMGALKTALYSDAAKNLCGKILKTDLGLSSQIFEGCSPNDAYLVTKEDITLPLRTDLATHKGNYGHTAVLAGEKSGAGIIAATAALNFGSGLTTLVKARRANLNQFKISPELMISKVIPKNATCVVLGPGYGTPNEASLEGFIDWFLNTENPAAVLDADMFNYPDFANLLYNLNKIKNARIVLTPHLKELSKICKNIYDTMPDTGFPEKGYSIRTLVTSPEAKIKIGQEFNRIFPNTVLVMKSANTFIAAEGQIYIIADGAPSLAKGGSGDVLAGLTGALLAQGYSAKDAAITACEVHATSATDYGAEAYDLTPSALIKECSTKLGPKPEPESAPEAIPEPELDFGTNE